MTLQVANDDRALGLCSTLLAAALASEQSMGHWQYNTAAAAQRNDISSAPRSKIRPSKASSTIPPMASVDDFGHDEDLMRCKHELLGYVYDKSLNRGFDGGQGQ